MDNTNGLPSQKDFDALPIVGVTTCVRTIDNQPFHVVGYKYLDGVLQGMGALPLSIPAFGKRLDIKRLFEVVDGLLFTGSPSNVSPHLYGQDRAHPDLSHDSERDETNLLLIHAALEAGLPFLGICRGFQELNVAMGGSLYQLVHEQNGKHDHRAPNAQPMEVQYGPAHLVTLNKGGHLHQWLGQDEITVNSIHWQGVDKLGDGLSVEAQAPDGLIEGIRVTHAKAFALAVQWHPEWQVTKNPHSMTIFRKFKEACVARHYSKYPHNKKMSSP